MTFDEKIKALNDLAIAWYSTSQADSIHEAIFRGQGYGKFADHCKEEAEEELEEAKKCTARMNALGGWPESGFVPQEIRSAVLYPVQSLKIFRRNENARAAKSRKTSLTRPDGGNRYRVSEQN